MKQSKNKNFATELKIIKQFESFKQHKVTLEDGSGEAYLTKSKKDFQLSFDGIFPHSEDKKIKILINGEPFTIKSTDLQKPTRSRLAEIPAQHPLHEVFASTLRKCLMTLRFL